MATATVKVSEGWTRFSKTDWYGLAGAARFEDGSEPFINHGLTVDGVESEAVIDAQGAAVLVYFEAENTTTQYSAFEEKAKLAAAWLALQPAGTDLSGETLVELGFEKQTDL